MTAAALTASRNSMSNVTAIRSGSVFQIGRPSGASQITFAARMKAAM